MVSDGGTRITSELAGDLRRRLNRMEGHVRGISKMLGRRERCDDILTQVAAIEGATTRVAIRLLDAHLRICMSEAPHSGKGTGGTERFAESLARILGQSRPQPGDRLGGTRGDYC